jgi:hypothetical protein
MQGRFAILLVRLIRSAGRAAQIERSHREPAPRREIAELITLSEQPSNMPHALF